MKIGQVHRFGDRVALYSGTGETAYMSKDAAMILSRAIAALCSDIEDRSFHKSQFATFNFAIHENDK